MFCIMQLYIYVDHVETFAFITLWMQKKKKEKRSFIFYALTYHTGKSRDGVALTQLRLPAALLLLRNMRIVFCHPGTAP